MPDETELPLLSAEALSRLIRGQEVSCREVVEATLAQIDRFNGPQALRRRLRRLIGSMGR